MKRGTIIYSFAGLAGGTLIALSAFAQLPPLKAQDAVGPTVFAPTSKTHSVVSAATFAAPRQFPWKTNIVTTVFWVGELPTANNPVPNRASSWDQNWTANYGGYDNPDPATRRDLIPAKFTPRQNPFYIALPYNDKARVGPSA
jgi:hypothetical protein